MGDLNIRLLSGITTVDSLGTALGGHTACCIYTDTPAVKIRSSFGLGPRKRARYDK